MLGHFLSLLVLTGATPASADPVTSFLTAADSSIAASEDALANLVRTQGILVGAAVARLVDEAVEAGDAGRVSEEVEKLTLAETIARHHLSYSQKRASLGLVAACREWGEAERARRREAKVLERKATEARDAGNLLAAIAHLHKARTIYTEIGDAYSEAVVWGSLGVVHWYAGDLDAVGNDYERALVARRAVDDNILVGRTLNGLGSVNYRKGRLAEAESYYTQAIEMRRRTGDDAGLGTSLTYLANVYVDMRRLDEARPVFEAAIPLVEANGTPRQRLELLEGYAKLDFETGRVNRATQSYREALAIAVAQGDVAGEISVGNNLATALDRQDRYQEALEVLARVESLLATHPDPVQSLHHLSNRGMVYVNAGEQDKARADLLAFLAEAEAYGDPSYQRQALINLGYLLKQMGALERAAEYAQRARAIAALSNDTRGEREATILAADIALAQGRGVETHELCERARELDKHDGATALLVHDDIGIASALARQERMDEARGGFQAAIPQAAATGQGFLVTVALFGIAHTWEADNADSAAHYYERSLRRVEETRTLQGGEGVRTGFLSGDRRFYYEEVARFYGRCDRDGHGDWAARAFTTIERAKARGLLDMVDDAMRRTPSPEEEAVLDELYSLDSKPGDKADRDKRRGQLEAEYIRLRDGRARHAYDRARANERIATVAEVQSHLSGNAAMVAYALGDTVSLVWAVTPSRHYLCEIVNRRTIAAGVDRLRDAIARPGAGDETLRAASRALYRELLEPVSDIIDGAGSLVIVPDGKLFELPFEVLLTEAAGENAQWKDLEFVARRFEETVVTPSASVWLELAHAGRGTYPREIVAFGDPDYAHLEAKAGLAGALEPLPYTREEVLAVSASVSDTRKAVYLGERANEGVLKRVMAEGTRVLHLAAHGLVDPEDPAMSSIALCPSDVTGDDGYLHTLEILSSPVEVGLVVLSACESGRGRIGRGEGVVGLSRAFIAAGARGVVASLWPVSDESTAALMSAFYRGMYEYELPAARAMRVARLALLENEDFSHPFHWAAFEVVGTARAPR